MWKGIAIVGIWIGFGLGIGIVALAGAHDAVKPIGVLGSLSAALATIAVSMAKAD